MMTRHRSFPNLFGITNRNLTFHQRRNDTLVHPFHHRLKEVEGFKFINKQRIFLFIGSVQYQEELAHATRFFDYLNERGGRVRLSPIGEVQVEFSGIVDVFEKTLEHEQLVTGMIDHLMDLSIQESDHATKSFLQWFVDEQVEEEANVDQILNNLKLIKGEGQGLLMMDREMKGRVFVNPFPAKA